MRITLNDLKVIDEESMTLYSNNKSTIQSNLA